MKTTNSNNLRDYPHVDLLYPSKYLKGAELEKGGDTFTITAIEPRHELRRTDDTKESKPVVRFKETEKGWVMNKTNAQTVAKLYGPEVLNWIGKRITLIPKTVNAFGKDHCAIRVKNTVPGGAAKPRAANIEEAMAGFLVAANAQELQSAWAGLPKGLTKEDQDRAAQAFRDRAAELKNQPVEDDDLPPHDPETGEVVDAP